MLNRLIVLGMVVLTLLGGGLFLQRDAAPAVSTPGATTLAQSAPVQTPSQQMQTAQAAEMAAPLADLDAYVQSAMESWNVPGAAIAVVKDGQMVLSKGYGVRDVNTEEPVTPRTLFAIGSTTKAFTTAALGMLVDAGRLSWDDKVVDHLPDFQLSDPWITRHATIRDLVTHRLGLERADLLWYAGKFDRDEVLQRIGNVAHTLRFRDQFGYQNVMYAAAGEVIESVTGKTWEAFVQERIFGPLGMLVSNTSTDDLQYYSNVATPHVAIEGDLQPIEYRNIDVVAPAGSINSNVREMAQWVRLQLGEGAYEGERLLDAATVREMHSPETIIDLSPLQEQLNPETHFSTYGLGWILSDYRGRKVAYHGGNIDGMSAHVSLVPEDELGVVVLTNMNVTPMPEILSQWIVDRFLGAPKKDWSQLYSQVYQQISRGQQQAFQQVQEQRTPGTEPSLATERYAGVYESDVYGELTIEPEEGQLVLRYGDFVGDLSHWHHDTFRVNWRGAAQAIAGPFFFANVRLDSRGQIDSLRLHDPLGQLDLGEFERVGDIEQQHAEILWDEWGVPHIFADDSERALRAFGWAQMRSHGDLILRLYGQARGRAAEYWGEGFLDSDREVRRYGIPSQADRAYMALDATMRGYLDAFAAGVNAYAREHADRISDRYEAVLPVTGRDVLAHAQRVFHFFATANGYAGGTSVDQLVSQWMGQSSSTSKAPDSARPDALGSNAVAVGPSRSASGNAMLMGNPHLAWSDFMRFYEAQITAPDYDAYGATLVGMPALAIAFNDHLGWTHTVNALDASDVYELTLTQDGRGYLLDGEIRSFRTQTHTLQVKQSDGSLRTETLTVKRSAHGPVVAERDGRALAVRTVIQDPPEAFRAWWRMGQARDLDGFEDALDELDLPFFTVMYADDAGHVMHLFNGRVPERSQGDAQFWDGIVPGDTSKTLWTSFHVYDELPKLVNPDSGWLQNANDPPWHTTVPGLDPQNYPAYMAPERMNFRAQQLANLLTADASITFEELIEIKHSTKMLLADRVLDELIPAARDSDSALAHRAADVLADWDRRADADSRGALLFTSWLQAVGADGLGKGLFQEAWNRAMPFASPRTLAQPARAVEALEQVASQLRARFGRLDVPWGEVMRFRAGDVDLPGNGASGDPAGVVRVVAFAPDQDGKFRSVFGDSFIMAVKFGDPVQARTLLTYGNASQAGSPHVGDQLELATEKQLRPVWRTRAEIQAHLSERTVVD